MRVIPGSTPIYTLEKPIHRSKAEKFQSVGRGPTPGGASSVRFAKRVNDSQKAKTRGFGPNHRFMNNGMPVWQLIMSKMFNASSVRLIGDSRAKSLMDSGHHIILAPNHPGHKDWGTVPIYAQKNGFHCNLLTASEGIPAPLLSIAKNLVGVVPLDRSSKETREKSMEVMQAALNDGTNAITLQPEGQVTWQNGRIAPLKHGVYLLAANAVKEGHKVAILPLGVKYYFRDDATKTLNKEIIKLAKKLGVDGAIKGKSADNAELLKRTETLWGAMLDQKSNLYLHRAFEGSLADKHREVVNELLNSVSEQLNKDVGHNGFLNTKLLKLRSHLKEMTEEERSALQERNGISDKDWKAFTKRMNEQMKDVNFLLKLSPEYLHEAPTQERIAEALHGISYLVTGDKNLMDRIGPRDFYIREGEPIVLDPANPETQELISDPENNKSGRDFYLKKIRDSLQTLVEDMQPTAPHKIL